LKPLWRSGLTSRTAFQNAVVAGSKKRGPQVVTASYPPGRSTCHSARTAAAMSGTKKIPKTQMTASK